MLQYTRMACKAAKSICMHIRPDGDRSNICTDTGASICVTGSLENTTNMVEISSCGDARKWNVDESHTRLHENILREEQIGRGDFADSVGALREFCQPGLSEREGMQ
jgi:hypothetical protein